MPPANCTGRVRVSSRFLTLQASTAITWTRQRSLLLLALTFGSLTPFFAVDSEHCVTLPGRQWGWAPGAFRTAGGLFRQSTQRLLVPRSSVSSTIFGLNLYAKRTSSRAYFWTTKTTLKSRFDPDGPGNSGFYELKASWILR